MVGYDTVGGTALGICKDAAVGSIGIVPLLVSLLAAMVSETLISADDDLDRDSFLKDKSGNAVVAVVVVVGDNESVLIYSVVIDGVLGLLSLDKGRGGSAPI